MFEFDRERLGERTAAFDGWQAAVFGAGCVQVLVPTYRRFADIEDVGDPSWVEGTLERVWTRLLAPEAGPVSAEGLPSPDDMLELLPDQDEDWNEWSACAENAVASLSFLLNLIRSGDRSLVGRIAQQAYEAVDHLASAELDPPVMTPDIAREILGSEGVQAELGRQDETIEALVAAAGRDPAVAGHVRAQAEVLSLGQED